MKKQLQSHERGFTLVELSIVMIIIGLLIGGILKGQELIANARLASTISKVKGIDAALNTFRDSYSGLPGDLDSTRLPNCATTTVCGSTPTAGTHNDGIIGTASATGRPKVMTTENMIAWAQLAAVDLIGGVSNVAAGSNVEEGVTVPESGVGGQLYLGYESGTVITKGYNGGSSYAPRGHYIAIYRGVTAPAATTVQAGPENSSLTPSQALRIDTKMDDGKPSSGSVLEIGSVGPTADDCSTAAGDTGIYNMVATTAICGVYIRIQQ